jgi:hypothetical protein
MNISFNTLLRPVQRDKRGIEDEERVMWYRIIDIIADRDLSALGRLAVAVTLLVIAALLGWLVISL